MSLMDFFKKKSTTTSTASTAKGRLQVIIAQERSECGGPDFLRLMRDELLDVVRKYIDVDPSAVRVQVDKDGAFEVLEVNIVLPEGTGASDLSDRTLASAPKPSTSSKMKNRSKNSRRR